MGLFLQGVTARDLCAALAAQGTTLDPQDARRIIAQVHRDEDPRTPSSGIRKSARDAVVAAATIPVLEVVSERSSQVDPFVKYALRTADGHVVETVRIPLEVPGRFSVCVSSQVGCALACAFCATGRMGLTRNLETWEIVEQVREVRRRSDGCRVHGVVFQGMGEPMANLDRVLAAIRVLTDPSAQAIDTRNITVCTSGLPAGIRRLAEEAPKVRLGLSLGSARPAVRRSLMPIDRAHGLQADVIDAAAEHVARTGLAPLWAVTLLAGVNDTLEDAIALADLVVVFRARTGASPRLSVIPYNPIDVGPAGESDPFARTSDDREAAFRDALRTRGVFTHRRYSGGSDVAAACGQLAARV
ncbi:MAG: Ribosomal large subunit methyltransferase [Labilithrix sp.]|nr:Ribosomal large subunit methyltransferase [Labilithrix sp.]